jgi:hypothetical protein
MLPAVLAAFEHVKANLSPFSGPELHSGKGPYRTGIHANMTFTTGPVEGCPSIQRGVRQHRDKACPRPEALSQQQAALANPAHPGQMGSQLVRKNSLQLIKIVRGRSWDREGLKTLPDQPPCHIISQEVQGSADHFIYMMPV